MRARIGVVIALTCALVACAPGRGSDAEQASPPVATSASESGAPASESTSEPEQSEASPSQKASSSSEPSTEPSPSDSSTDTAPAPKPGWSVLDTKLSSASEVDALPVSAEVAHYLKSRMGEPCELEMTLFAVHSDGYLVADETGICDGAALFVYGPNDGEIEELSSSLRCLLVRSSRRPACPRECPRRSCFLTGWPARQGRERSAIDAPLCTRRSLCGAGGLHRRGAIHA